MLVLAVPARDLPPQLRQAFSVRGVVVDDLDRHPGGAQRILQRPKVLAFLVLQCRQVAVQTRPLQRHPGHRETQHRVVAVLLKHSKVGIAGHRNIADNAQVRPLEPRDLGELSDQRRQELAPRRREGLDGGTKRRQMAHLEYPKAQKVRSPALHGGQRLRRIRTCQLAQVDVNDEAGRDPHCLPTAETHQIVGVEIVDPRLLNSTQVSGLQPH